MSWSVKKDSRVETILGFVLIAAIGFGLYSCFRPATVEEQAADRCTDTTMAFNMSQNFVAGQLGSPSTASFPSSNVQDVGSRNIGECEFEVVGYVDSQNSSGATVRSHYTMKLRYNPASDDWTGWDLKIQ